MGTRFPSLCNAYDEDLRRVFREVAIHQGKGHLIKEGVYVCQSGPCYETPAECNFLRMIGCDAAGMSTVNEVVACRHLDMKVFAISLITNIVGSFCFRDVQSVMPGVTDYVAPSHQEVDILCLRVVQCLNGNGCRCREHADPSFPYGGVHRESVFELWLFVED